MDKVIDAAEVAYLRCAGGSGVAGFPRHVAERIVEAVMPLIEPALQAEVEGLKDENAYCWRVVDETIEKYIGVADAARAFTAWTPYCVTLCCEHHAEKHDRLFEAVIALDGDEE